MHFYSMLCMFSLQCVHVSFCSSNKEQPYNRDPRPASVNQVHTFVGPVYLNAFIGMFNFVSFSLPQKYDGM